MRRSLATLSTLSVCVILSCSGEQGPRSEDTPPYTVLFERSASLQFVGTYDAEVEGVELEIELSNYGSEGVRVSAVADEPDVLVLDVLARSDAVFFCFEDPGDLPASVLQSLENAGIDPRTPTCLEAAIPAGGDRLAVALLGFGGSTPGGEPTYEATDGRRIAGEDAYCYRGDEPNPSGVCFAADGALLAQEYKVPGQPDATASWTATQVERRAPEGTLDPPYRVVPFPE